MTAIWVIERHDSEPSLARRLMGDYAVRTIASLQSLERLLRISKSSRPSALVLEPTMLNGGAMVDDILGRLASSKIPMIVAGSPEGRRLGPRHPSCTYYEGSEDAMSIVRFVDDLLSSQTDPAHSVQFESLILNLAELTLHSQIVQETIDLTPKEARLIHAFFIARSRPVTRDELLREVWGKTAVASRTIDSQVSRLRKRLADFGVEIDSVYGGGYRLNAPAV